LEIRFHKRTNLKFSFLVVKTVKCKRGVSLRFILNKILAKSFSHQSLSGMFQPNSAFESTKNKSFGY